MSFLKILNSALDNAAERPIFRTIYVAKNHKSLAGHLRLISTHALRCKCIYLPSRSPKMLSMTLLFLQYIDGFVLHMYHHIMCIYIMHIVQFIYLAHSSEIRGLRST